MSRGFTLLELLVVVFIVGVLAAMFTLSVGVAGGSDREQRRVMERLETLVRLAVEDAGFQNRQLGLRLYPDRYEFSTLDPGQRLNAPEDDRWVVLDEAPLTGAAVPEVFRFELEIEGRAVKLDAPRIRQDDEKKTREYVPQIYIFSSGDVSDAFTVHLRDTESDIGYTLEVAADGTATLDKDDG